MTEQTTPPPPFEPLPEDWQRLLVVAAHPDDVEYGDAARDGGNRWVFPSGHVEPWNGVHAVWAAHSPESRHAVDVTGTFAAGVASLRAHEAYLAGLGAGSPDPEEFLEGMARSAGTRLGCKFAVPFEVFPLQLF
jgi:LmbE family N-acetylglucosaminyl deacetylase